MRHEHNLDSITGYRVVETNREADMFGSARIVAEFFGADKAGNADTVARAITANERRGFGTIDRVYSCGCFSVARQPGERDLAGMTFEEHQTAERSRR